VVLDRLGQELVLGPGEGSAHRFGFHLTGPQIIGSLFDGLAPDLAQQGTADQGALADPGALGQLGLEALVSRGRRAQVGQVGEGSRWRGGGHEIFCTNSQKGA